MEQGVGPSHWTGMGLLHRRPNPLSAIAVNVFFRSDRDDLAGAVCSHADPVYCLGRLHRPAVMRDDDELRVLGQLSQDTSEAVYVGFVQHGVHFVQNTEGWRRDFKQREDERGGGQGALTARK